MSRYDVTKPNRHVVVKKSNIQLAPENPRNWGDSLHNYPLVFYVNQGDGIHPHDISFFSFISLTLNCHTISKNTSKKFDEPSKSLFSKPQ